MEGDTVIGLADVTGGGAISLEPGGQFELSGAPLETIHQTAQRTDGASGAIARGGKALGHRLSRHGHDAGLAAGGHAGDAQGPLPDHDILHAEGRHPRPRHDVPDLHRAGEPRLFLRSRHGEEDAGGARAAAARHGAVRQFAVHGGAAERLRLVPLRNLARHRQRSRRACCPSCSSDGFGFERYVDYALDVPMYFLKRGDRLHRRLRPLVPRIARWRIDVASRRAGDDVGLGQPRLHDLPGGAAQALHRDARHRDGGPWRSCRRCPPSGSGCSTTRTISMPAGGW